MNPAILYGANIFMLDEFETDLENQKYRDLFYKYFNLATIPFYWEAIEPEEGELRYNIDGPKMYRRPTPDRCIKYCDEKGIMAKLHCLVYDTCTPKWAHNLDEDSLMRLYEKRFCGIAAFENGTYRILLWNCNLPEIKNQPVWKETVKIPGITANEYIFEQAKIEKGRGSAYEEWVKMGKPANLTPFEESYLNACAEMNYSIINIDSKNAVFNVNLKPDEVCYIEAHKRTKDIALKTKNELLEQQLTPITGAPSIT